MDNTHLVIAIVVIAVVVIAIFLYKRSSAPKAVDNKQPADTKPPKVENYRDVKPTVAIPKVMDSLWLRGLKESEANKRYAQIREWMNAAYPGDFKADEDYVMLYISNTAPDNHVSRMVDNPDALMDICFAKKLGSVLNVLADAIASQCGYRVVVYDPEDLDKVLPTQRARRTAVISHGKTYRYAIAREDMFEGSDYAQRQLEYNSILFNDPRFCEVTKFMLKVCQEEIPLTSGNDLDSFTDLKKAVGIKKAILANGYEIVDSSVVGDEKPKTLKMAAKQFKDSNSEPNYTQVIPDDSTDHLEEEEKAAGKRKKSDGLDALTKKSSSVRKE